MQEHYRRGHFKSQGRPLAAWPALLTLMLMLMLILLLAWAAPPASAQTPTLQVPFVPTPQSVVDRMLAMAKVTGKDIVYDLGSGDGRIVITAAKRYGAKGVGIDLDPQRIKEARENAVKAGVDKQVQFIAGDLFKADLSDATVVTLYLLGSVNRDLRPQLWRQLKVGTRVVSHAFDMGDWVPEKTDTVDGRNIYYWTITEANKRAAEDSKAVASTQE